jgi:hypothetical protein
MIGEGVGDDAETYKIGTTNFCLATKGLAVPL